jgi:cytidine deaminase
VSHATDHEALRRAAFAVLEHAYAPYSRFRVGAALLCADGTVVAGCNLENAAFPAGLCAERNALAAAIALGHREFRALVVASDADEPAPPCGVCRQSLVEFAPVLEITSVTRAGSLARWSLRELLPQPFTPASLTHA